MKYLIGIDVGTHALRCCLFDLDGNKVSDASVSYETSMPRESWVEQNPDNWWAALIEALRQVMRGSGIKGEEVAALSYACTSCTVVVLDRQGQPLRPAVMWMDERAYREAELITATRHPHLRYCGGEVSPQWMLPKALWLSKHEPEIFQRAYRIVEQTDYFTYHLTGRWTISQNNATSKWNYVSLLGGFASDLITAIGAVEIAAKWPEVIMAAASPVGRLRPEIAEMVGLSPSTLVVQGGIDAHAAMAGLTAIQPGDVSIVVGTSTCLMAQSLVPVFANVWGPYPDSVMKGVFTLGGGQTTTGAIIDWLLGLAASAGSEDFLINLDKQAEDIPAGSEGLVALDFFQGNRNPYKDPQARGAVWGLTLRHGLPHLCRAFYEAIAFGVRNILEDLSAHDYRPNRVLAGGGGAKSRLWMQIHADVIGLPIQFCQEAESTALGAAIWAGVGAGLFGDFTEASARMVRLAGVLSPNPEVKAIYDFYYRKYVDTYKALRPLMHEVVAFEEERTGRTESPCGGFPA